MVSWYFVFTSAVVITQHILNVSIDDECDIHGKKWNTNFSVQFKAHAGENPKGYDQNEKQNETKFDVWHHYKTSWR